MPKLNIKDIATIYLAATGTSVATGLVGSYLWSKFSYDVDYGLVTASTWLLTVGAPSCLVSMETLRRKLGERQTVTISAVGGQHNGRRAIPTSSATGKKSHVFLSVLPLPLPSFRLQEQNHRPEKSSMQLPGRFVVSAGNVEYSATKDEIEQFLRVAWRRQQRGQPAFSRDYWTRQHRPRLKSLDYKNRLHILQSVDNLILDRSQGRSGRLAVPPLTAISALEGRYFPPPQPV